MITPRRHNISLIAILASTALTVLVTPAAAGPVTNPWTSTLPVGQAPYTRLGIYRQALDVVSFSEPMTRLRFNGDGRTISGTSDIIFRPSTLGTANSAVAAANGVAVKKNDVSDLADLYIPGKLYLYNHATNEWVGNDTVNTAGASLWQEITTDGISYLEPSPIAGLPAGVQLGTPGTPVTTGAVRLNEGGGALALNHGLGYAADFGGALKFSKSVNVNEAILIDGIVPWFGKYFDTNSGVNVYGDGQDSGLDADLANGNQVTIETAANCTNTDPGKPRVACLCFSIKYTFLPGVSGFGNHENTTPEKHCIDLANRF
jgi:hypothetical protein